MSRRGVTLVELGIGLVLFGIIGTVLVRAMMQIGRAVSAMQERAESATALDQGAAFLGAELSEVGQGDIRTVSGDAVSYRGYRLAGLACRVTGTTVDLRVQSRSGARDPQPGRDTLLLYLGEGDSISWRAFPLLAVSGTTCDSLPAVRLTTSIDSASLARARLLSRVPVRLFEGMQARLYRSGDAWWLGARSESAGEGIQPLAGPFLGTSSWSYRDSAGHHTTVATLVRSFALQLDVPSRDSAVVLLYPANLTR